MLFCRKRMNIEISEMVTNNRCSNMKNNENKCRCVCDNTIVDAPAVPVIKPYTGGIGAIDGSNNILGIDYKAIARAALSTISDDPSEMDLYLTIFDSNPTAFTCISTLHQNGPADALHFGFVLSINAYKQTRFRVNGWLSNGFKIQNLQKRVNGTYVTVATMA